MCESKVIVEGKPERVIKDVVKVVVNGNEIRCYKILGEEIKLKARIKEIDLLAHKIIME